MSSLVRAQVLTGSPQVVIENLTKQYGTLCALGGVSFGVHTGEWVALMGPSGSGKTTLINILGGLDTLKAACLAGAEEVSIAVTKPPAAWKGIPYVEKLGLDLDRLAAATVLFEGSAREGVPHFPANVNIAAVLSMAGIGFDRTRLKVVADPALKFNTHFIVIRGKTGRIDIKFESVAMPENPKTSMLACFSALAAIRELGRSTRYGT